MSLGLLAVAVSVLWAEPPVREVILESESWLIDEVSREGPAAIWIEGVKYKGALPCTGEGRINPSRYDGTETHVYDFGELGTLEFSGVGRSSFHYVSPEHRRPRCTAQLRVTSGTGAFAQATGAFQFVGYTEWHLPSPPWPYAFLLAAAGRLPGSSWTVQIDREPEEPGREPAAVGLAAPSGIAAARVTGGGRRRALSRPAAAGIERR